MWFLEMIHKSDMFLMDIWKKIFPSKDHYSDAMIMLAQRNNLPVPLLKKHAASNSQEALQHYPREKRNEDAVFLLNEILDTKYTGIIEQMFDERLSLFIFLCNEQPMTHSLDTSLRDSYEQHYSAIDNSLALCEELACADKKTLIKNLNALKEAFTVPCQSVADFSKKCLYLKESIEEFYLHSIQDNISLNNMIEAIKLVSFWDLLSDLVDIPKNVNFDPADKQDSEYEINKTLNLCDTILQNQWPLSINDIDTQKLQSFKTQLESLKNLV